MYIWVGINVDSQLENVGKKVREIEENLGYKNFCYTLPMHISLKISFYAPDKKTEQIISDIREIYKGQKAFEIDVSGVENLGGIAWIRMKESSELNALSDKLNSMLFSRHGIPLHEYDTDYKFHSTLFMGNEVEVAEELSMLGNINIPEKLTASRFIIGFSHSGEFGTYSVSEEITI